MPSKSPKPRSRHSFRDRIRQVILDRMARGATLHVRDIIKEAGGGSATTVKEELAKCPVPTAGTRAGLGANTPAQRIALLEQAVNESMAREQALATEAEALRAALDSARADVEKLLVEHQDSQRMLLQAVDDLRQISKAGQEAATQAAALPSAPRKGELPESGEGLLWKARHDELLQRFVALDAKCRRMAGQLHEVGIDVD